MGWKMPVVLSCMFCLMINCLSACFDRISALSAGGGCHSKPARGTKNFDKVTNSSGNRRIFASMLKMRLTGTSLCQCCRFADEILSAPNSLLHASAFRRTAQISCQTLERPAKSQKQNAVS